MLAQVGTRLLLDFVMMLGGAVGVGLPMALAIIWVCSWPFPPPQPTDDLIIDGDNSGGEVQVGGPHSSMVAWRRISALTPNNGHQRSSDRCPKSARKRHRISPVKDGDSVHSSARSSAAAGCIPDVQLFL